MCMEESRSNNTQDASKEDRKYRLGLPDAKMCYKASHYGREVCLGAGRMSQKRWPGTVPARRTWNLRV